MGCNCGGASSSSLANYEVLDANNKVVKTFAAVTETEVKTFAAKNSSYSWRKKS